MTESSITAFSSKAVDSGPLSTACISDDCFWLIVVSILWGSTNPFLKKGSKGIDRVKQNNIFLQLLSELKFLFLNWRYILPFLINMSGSVIYYITLASAELSVAVPITNSLTFVFTGLVGRLMGEHIHGTGSYIGMLLVAVGVAICVYSKTPVSS